ncbi:MAG: hypothetical protein H6739_01085 [Alphaproteobacteria bacterium]|nr:hypothetical protein [Alphaproteobacteria bacterium]
MSSPPTPPASPEPASAPPAPAAPAPAASGPVNPQGCACGGSGAGVAPAPGFMGHVYAIGQLRFQFPNRSVTQEFNQASGRLQNVMPDSWLPFAVLGQGRNVYLARDTCWVMQVPGPNPAGRGGDPAQPVDAYILKPRSIAELNEMVDAIQPRTGEIVYIAAIGSRGPVAPPEICNGLQLPVVVVNQLYGFTETDFVNGVSGATGVSVSSVASTFNKLMSLSDNAGATPEHRAINYLMLRYPNIYTIVDQLLNDGTGPYSFSSITARKADVQGVREIVEVVMHFTQRVTQVRIQWSCKVDTTGQFPFMVAPLSPYYPHP